jgi:hypothetical protein
MRRAATWLVVGAVLVVGGVAVFDVLQRDAETPAEPATSLRKKLADPLADAARRVEEAGVVGTLYLARGRDVGCELREMTLPNLEMRAIPGVNACRFAVGLAGGIATGEDCRSSGEGVLWDQDGNIVERFDGCAPAWTPAGVLSFLREGSIVKLRTPCTATPDRCARIAVSKSAVRHAFDKL